MSLEEAQEALCVEREARIKAETAIVEHWEPLVTGLKSKYAAANSRIAVLNKTIAELTALPKPEPETKPQTPKRRWGHD